MMKTLVKYFLLLFIALNVYAHEDDLLELRAQVKALSERIDAYYKNEELKTQLEILSKRLDSYSKNEKPNKLSIEKTDIKKTEAKHKNVLENILSLVPSDKKGGGLELKTADTVLSVGGRIQLHSIYAWPEGKFFAGNIPLEKDSLGENGQLTMSARDSRFWVKTRTPSKYGPIRALIETDFMGTAVGTEANTNSHGIRLRHAYVQVGGFTVGQTNSAFNSLVTLDTISYAVNDTLVRQPLIRYSIYDKDLTYDISFEQPETTLLNTAGDIITPKDDSLPDIVTRVRYYPPWGEASAAFLARYIKQDHTTLSDGSVSDSTDGAFGWGANISAKIKTFDLDDIRFDAQYGVGLGRYIAYDAYAAGSIDSTGNIKLHPVFGAHLGYRHWWNTELRSTLGLSYAGTDNNIENIQDDDLYKVNKDVYSLQFNLLWIPVRNALVGVEYAKALRNVESEDEGHMDMLIFLVRYDF